MKKQEQAVGAGAATTRAGECHFSGAARVQADFTLEAALPQSKQFLLLERLCRSPCEKPLAFRSQVKEIRGSASMAA